MFNKIGIIDKINEGIRKLLGSEPTVIDRNEIKKEWDVVELPKYLTYDKVNKIYRIRRGNIYYGSYDTLHEALDFYDKIVESGWDRRVGYNLPLDKVDYDERRRLFTIYYTDGEDYFYEPFRQARAVKSRLHELEMNGYFIVSPKSSPYGKDQTGETVDNVDETVDEVTTNNTDKPRSKYVLKYHYMIDKELFRLPWKSGKGIRITADEAIQIIRYHKEGKTIPEIYKLMDFKHDINISTVENWIRKYDEGLMDMALNFILDNGHATNPPMKSEVLKNPDGGIL